MWNAANRKGKSIQPQSLELPDLSAGGRELSAWGNRDVALLSIVIPTRNRFDYVQSAIRSVLNIPSSSLELVIHDNSDCDELETWLAENISDSRLVYRHSKKTLSMIENYDEALGVATGEFVCLIGDDDGVNPEIVIATQWARKYGYDALVPNSVINYVWPDLHMTTRGAHQAGELVIRPFTGEKSFPDGEAEMKKCAASAGQRFFMLPKAYYGVVLKKRLDQVKQKTGSYFPGVSPDMSVAIAVANFADRICYVDYPLFVPGSSAKSNAGLSGLNRHIGWLRDQPHLPRTIERDWSKITPQFYSVETIWAEAAVSSLISLGRNDVLKEFNVPWLYAYCSICYLQYMRGAIVRFYGALRVTGRGALVGTIQFLYWYIYLMARQVKIVLRGLMNKPGTKHIYRVTKIQNVNDAVIAVSEFLEKSGLHFPREVR